MIVASSGSSPPLGMSICIPQQLHSYCPQVLNGVLRFMLMARLGTSWMKRSPRNFAARASLHSQNVIVCRPSRNEVSIGGDGQTAHAAFESDDDIDHGPKRPDLEYFIALVPAFL